MTDIEQSQQAIDAFLESQGLDPKEIGRKRIGRPSVLRDNFDELGRMYRAGYNATQIAKHFGVAPSTVRSFLHRNPYLKY
jgi:hypothetical protein